MDELGPDRFFDLSAFSHKALFEGCRYVWEVFAKLKDYLRSVELGNINIEVPEGVYLVNSELISIAKGVTLEPGAYIKGPCILEEGCTVRHGAYIRGDLIAGKGAIIGHATEVKHSILLNHANAAHFAYVGDSILGNKVNLGAGTKCANLRFDQQEVVVSYHHQKFPTGLKKMGLIAGDHAQTGCNSVMNPGTILGKGARCFPCSSVLGIVPENSVIKANLHANIS